MLTACICGGGSLRHALAAVLGVAGLNVNVLTRHPEAWSARIMLVYGDNVVLVPWRSFRATPAT
jgi:hypothetical protein